MSRVEEMLQQDTAASRAVDLLVRLLLDCRRERVSGKLSLELELSEGGITKMWSDKRKIER